MTGLLVAVLIMCAALAALAWFAHRYAAFWHNTLVNNRFAEVNEIVMTEDVPGSWRVKILERWARRNPDAPVSRKLAALLNRWYVYRLDRLLHQVKISSVIKKQDKQELMETLREIRSEWFSRAI